MPARTRNHQIYVYAQTFYVGGNTSAKGMAADLVASAYSKGAFAGLSLDGSGMKVSVGSNHAYDGQSVRPTDILGKQSVHIPTADDLRSAPAKLNQ